MVDQITRSNTHVRRRQVLRKRSTIAIKVLEPPEVANQTPKRLLGPHPDETLSSGFC